MSKQTKSVVLLNREEIIKRVEAGEELTSIIKALNLQVTPPAISKRLAQDPEYIAARVSGMEQRLDNLTNKLEISDNRDDILRYEKLCKLQQWKLERLVRDKYGTQPNVAIQINTTPTTELLDKEVKDLIKDIRE